MPKFNNADEFMLDLAKGLQQGATPGEEGDTQPVEEENTGDAGREEQHDDVEETGTEGNEEEVVEEDSQEGATVQSDEEWDFEGNEDESTETTTEDYSELTKELGFNKVEELVDAFKEQKKLFESIPDDLKKAIELAQTGVDYLDYLGVATIDYDAVGDRDLLFHNMRSYFDSDEELEDYLDDMGDTEVKIRGKQLRQQLKAEQQSYAQQKEVEVKKRMAEAEKKLSESVGKLKTVNGFKVKPTHKKAILESFKTGDINKVFYGDGDYDKMVENAFKVKYFDAIVDFMRQRVANDTKRQMVDEISNPNLNRSKSKPDAKPETRTPMDLYMEQLLNRK